MGLPPALLPLVDVPRRVDVRAIDRELADLWRAAAESSETERIVLSRARTLTLLIYAADPAAGARLGDVAARTCQRHPGRALLLVADPAEPDLAAEVNAVCQVRRRDHRQVCCEQILIRAHPRARQRLPSLVRQLTLSDMPVALYWTAPLPDDDLFLELSDLVDRAVVDSAAAPDGLAGLLTVHRLAAGGSGPPALGDLAWSRITAWRGLTARFFDPPHTGAADRITRVRVAHAASSQAQGLLYLGWLAGRLRWHVERPFARGGGPWRATLVDPRGGPVAVSLHPESRAAHGAGALLSTMIVTAGQTGDNGGATFAIVRKDDAGGLVATAEVEGGIVRRAVPLDPPDEASLLAAEMDTLSPDRVFEDALAAAAALLGQP